MSQIEVGCELSYQVNSPTSFLLQIAAARTPHQQVTEESLSIEPQIDYDVCQLGPEQNSAYRLYAEPGELSLTYKATVELNPDVRSAPQLDEVAIRRLPTETLPYLNPSRYCESDRLGRLAADEFGDVERGFARVQAVADWTYEKIAYVTGTTDSNTGACDVLVQHAGVCRDFAHVAIALCRALCIPARYVSGYAVGLDPPDFHGFFEVYLGSDWYLFDASRLVPIGGLVRIGTGRDAADASFATILGAALLQNKNVWARNAGSGPLTPYEEQWPAGTSTA